MSPSRQNSEALWPLFDVLLLERFVASVHGAAASETRFHALVQDIATLPLSEAQRARLWFHLIIQRDADSLVQDVAALAPALASLSPQMQDTWERYIDDAVRDISSRFSSHDLLLLLKTRIDLANAQDLQIGTVLVDWARVITNPSLATHLQPSDVKVEASASPPTVATLTPPTVPAADAVPTDALERWVLSTLGSDEEAVSALRREARFLLSTISEVLESPATMVLMKLSEQAELAQQAISHWRVLPPADRIIRQRSACIHAYSKAKSAVSSGVLDGLLLTGIEPDALVELIDLVEQAHIWNAMPQWWWVALTSDTTTGPGSGKASDTWIRAFSQTQNRRLARCNRSRGDSGRQASSQVRG